MFGKAPAFTIVLATALAAVAASPRIAAGQIPGAPVLQNAWATPGIVGALDISGGSGQSVYAAAASWTPGSGRFQLSGGAGIRTQTDAASGGVYGARVAIPLGGASSSFGFAGFAGIGGGKAAKPKLVFFDSTASTTEIPVGAAIGWRHAIGASHGLSVYATPSYVFFTGGTKNDALFRMGIGADVGVTKAIGVTVGGDFGGTRPRGFGGPSGALFGLGVSYALGHR